MAEQREVEAVVGRVSSSQQFEMLSRTEKKAKLVEILDRGLTSSRLDLVDLPKDLHLEWVSRDPLSIAEMEAKGFWIDTEHTCKSSIHGKGSGETVIGDVVAMVCKKETYDIMEEIKKDRFIASQVKPKRQSDVKTAESGLSEELRAHGGMDGITVIDESKQEMLKGNEVVAAIKSSK